MMSKMGLSLQPHPLATAASSTKREMDIFHRPLTDRQLNEYEECTYFTRKEILRLYRRFSALNPARIDRRTGDVTTRLSFLDIQSMCELQHNPFKERLCEVFATDQEGLNFEDFLDMFSVLSVHAPWDLKAAYAFRIYDFNNDNLICAEDIRKIISALTGERLAEEKQEAIATRVITESDVIEEGTLSYPEFEHVVARSPEFVSHFHITI